MQVRRLAQATTALDLSGSVPKLRPEPLVPELSLEPLVPELSLDAVEGFGPPVRDGRLTSRNRSFVTHAIGMPHGSLQIPGGPCR